MTCCDVLTFLEPLSILSKGHWRWPHVWPELLEKFWDIGAQMVGSHAWAPKYAGRNKGIAKSPRWS